MKKELPDGWEWKKLGDVCKIQTGKKDVNEGNIDGKYSFFTCASLPSMSDTYSFDGEAIVLPGNGVNVGQSTYYDGMFEAYQRTYVLNNFSEYPKYIAYYFKYFWKSYLQGKHFGSATNYIKMESLENFTISFPTFEMQHKIVTILEKAEETKILRAQADELTQQLLQNVFLEMFGESSEKDWFMSNIEEVVHPSKGSVRTGPFGSQLLHGEFVDEGIAVLGIDNAVKNEFQWGKRRFISESKYNELKRYTVHPGDVLITIMGTCGRCAIVPDDIPIAINTKHLCCITLDQDKCLPIYLHGYFLQHPIARHYLSSKANGAIMDGLNMRIIKEMPIPIAPIELQRKYATIVQKLNETKRYQQQSSQEVDTLFNALMQKAFTGELVS